MTVTGIALVPDGSHNDYATGGWIPRDTYDELFDGFKFHTADIALRPGADAATVTERIGRAAAAVLGGPEAAGDVLVPPAPPTQQAELLQVRRMPVFLAVFLTVLAFGAVGHALATAVRRRRRDIAVLRAVGMTGWQCRAMVVTQATLLALFGLAIGVPTGFALGRVLWRSVADSTPLDYVPPVAAWALILIAPVALLAVNLLAAWPSQRAASIRVGHVLRTE